MPEIEKIALTLQSIFAYGRKMKHIYKPLSTMLLSLLLIACNGSETAPEAVSRKKTQAEDLNTDGLRHSHTARMGRCVCQRQD